jgi:NAD(P)-dependent dehydrogenase (short-subunit alcohol dehydrogenase family)
MQKFSFADRVAIVTGAGTGLGRSHALQLAAAGAKVVVNDLGGARDGSGSGTAAQQVVDEIEVAGGKAMASTASVVDEHQVADMVAQTLSTWGRVDILVNNAGILRDKSFAKMTLDDWRSVVDVHLNGSAYCSHAVWLAMREQGYGRIVMTTSTSGIYGNFGQANYGAAKFGVVGLMNVLCIEGRKYNIHVNCLAPSAATRMTKDVMPPDVFDALAPEYVSPAVLYLVSEQAPSRKILLAGAGCYTVAKLMEGPGVYLPPSQRTPEQIAACFEQIDASDGGSEILEGNEHIEKIVRMAAAHAQSGE